MLRMAQENLYRFFHSMLSYQTQSDPKRTKLDLSDNDLELDKDDENDVDSWNEISPSGTEVIPPSNDIAESTACGSTTTSEYTQLSTASSEQTQADTCTCTLVCCTMDQPNHPYPINKSESYYVL
uniref:Uncharacterized protein n=1 Tax=Amphimedon queenslandica TaxID=400682 RepID=A0A1X7VYJ4_AMPQE